MPGAKRLARDHTEEWVLIREWCQWPEQRLYELIRPVVLFGTTTRERADQTQAAEKTVRRTADTFEEDGVLSLFRPSRAQQAEHHRSLPVPMRQLIVDLHAEYAGFTLREIGEICYIQFGRRPSHNTVKEVLADGPAPQRVFRRYPVAAQIAEPAERRLAMVRLHAEGWSITSISRYLDVTRKTVYSTLRRWVEEGVRGLDDKSHINTNRVRKVDLRTRETVRQLQSNPRLGEFRMHGALKLLGIQISPRTCGRIMAEHRTLYGIGKELAEEPRPARDHPFKGSHRHERWCLDIRYIEKHQVPGAKGALYVITIMDAFSRAILASGLFQSQALSCVLIVLYAAIREFGCPQHLITDNGGVFRAKQALTIYETLEIDKKWIEKRQSWENLVEAHFSIMRRIGDFEIERAVTWEGAKLAHERFVQAYNEQPHYAHRKRQDGLVAPADVLGHKPSLRRYTPEQLHRLFYATRFVRFLDRGGYIRFRRWRIYGEEELARRQVAVWVYGTTLTLEYANAPLTQYEAIRQPDKQHFRRIGDPRQFQTPFTSEQGQLWPADEIPRRMAYRLPDYARRKRRKEATSLIPSEIPGFASGVASK
ncbi:MAG: transposase [Ktedonobacterales bacterium]|nr:transposase [Ktedonobacterales bacterium]